MASTSEGGSGRTITRKPRRPPGTIPTAPRRPPPGTGGGGYGTGTGTTGGAGGAGSTGAAGAGGAGGSGGYSYAAAQSAANKKWLSQAATMQQQIDALKIALGSNGLRKALRVQLANVFGVAQDDLDRQRKDYRQRVGSLSQAEGDNAARASDQSYSNLANRGRERANALSEATLQGAGESDMLAVQGASLRNWNANQSDINTSYYDTLTSINSSLTDLNVDTRTGLIQTAQQANADRSGLWTDYFGNRSETLTTLGNALGRQAEYYGLAQEAAASAGTKAKQTKASNQSGVYFNQAARLTGAAWKNPGVSKTLLNWKGAGPFEGELGNTEWHGSDNTATTVPQKKPEGATLREWRT